VTLPRSGRGSAGRLVRSGGATSWSEEEVANRREGPSWLVGGPRLRIPSVCLSADVAMARRVATSEEGLARICCRDQVGVAVPVPIAMGAEAGARLASRACGLRVPLLAASGDGLVSVAVTVLPYSMAVPSFHGRRWSGLVQTRASGGFRSVSSQFRSSILGCQSVVAPACMASRPCGVPRVWGGSACGPSTLWRSEVTVLAGSFLFSEFLLLWPGLVVTGDGVGRVAEVAVVPCIVNSSESECCELLYLSVRLPCKVRVHVAVGCSCCCAACVVSVVARRVHAVVVWLAVDSLAVVFPVWRTLAGKSRCGAPMFCVLCRVAPLVERYDTCMWLLSAWCWLVVSFGEVLLEFFSVGSDGTEVPRLVALYSGENNALVVLMEVLLGPVCVAFAVLLAAVFSLMVRVVWVVHSAEGSSQDHPLSILVEVLPKSARCSFRATVVLPLWFEVCRLVGLRSGEVLPGRLLAFLVEVLPKAASCCFGRRCSLFVEMSCRCCQLDCLCYSLLGRCRSRCCVLGRVSGCYSDLVSVVGVWLAVLLVEASALHCGFPYHAWKRLVAMRVFFLYFPLVAPGGDTPLWYCAAGVRIHRVLVLECFGFVPSGALVHCVVPRVALGACDSTMCCAMCLFMTFECCFTTSLGVGGVALSTSGTPLSVVRQVVVVACVLVSFSLLERVCLVVVPYFGLGPSEVDMLSSTSVAISVPVWLYVLLVVGMLVPALSPVCAWPVCYQLSLVLPLCVALVSLEADGGVSYWFVRLKALAGYPFPPSLLFFPFPSSPLMGRFPSGDRDVVAPAGSCGAVDRRRGLVGGLGLRIPSVCLSVDVATARHVATSEEASVRLVLRCPSPSRWYRDGLWGCDNSCVASGVPWPSLCVGVCPRAGFALRTFWYGTRVLMLWIFLYVFGWPMTHSRVCACLALVGLVVCYNPAIRRGFVVLPHLFARCLALEGLSRSKVVSIAWDPHPREPVEGVLRATSEHELSHVVVLGMGPQLGQAAVLRVLCVLGGSVSPFCGGEAGARLASRACGLRVPLLVASGGGLVAVAVTALPYDVSKYLCFWWFPLGVLSVPQFRSWVPVRSGTGVYGFPTLRCTRGQGWFCLWTLDPVKVCRGCFRYVPNSVGSYGSCVCGPTLVGGRGIVLFSSTA
ncbi:hypothetical protein Taro_044426, partial [Colocasia esculenta]|nr:hypothetical protein [Colocasia esculenta]